MILTIFSTLTVMTDAFETHWRNFLKLLSDEDYYNKHKGLRETSELLICGCHNENCAGCPGGDEDSEYTTIPKAPEPPRPSCLD
jgi:hypothetical protein